MRSKAVMIEGLSQHFKLPTPWQEVRTAWSDAAGIRLLIKRDDLIHPFISGNKWRKLVGFLRKHSDFERIHTFGGPYSNHIVAVAAAAHLLGLGCSASIRGEEPRRWSTVLQLCHSWGMELHFGSRSAYRADKVQDGLIDKVLWVPEGGQGPEGMVGCRDIYLEDPLHLDYCVLACGTGTTLAGLAQVLPSETRLIGVPVLRNGAFIADQVRSWTGQTVMLELDHHFGGYARTSPELMAFIRQFATETQILLDPIYTAKAFYAAQSMVERGTIEPGSTFGLVHTGGLTGWYGKWTELRE